MAKKLTILGVLAALVVGVLGMSTRVQAQSAAQNFATSGTFEVDATTCFGGSYPSTPLAPVGSNPCNGGSDSAVGAGATLTAYSVNRIPTGDRLSLAVTVLGPEWAATTYACAPTTLNACNSNVKASEAVSGDVYAETNLFCHTVNNSPYNADILADAPPYTPINFRRSAQESGVNGGAGPLTAGGATGTPSGDYAYIEDVQPFPAGFTFVAQDSADLDNLFLGGSTPFPLAPTVPLILYTRRANFGTSFTQTYVQLAGSPAPPDDQYLCTDSPQNSIVTLPSVTTPATPGIYPRTVLYTSAIDLRGTQVTRIIDLQCVAVGAPVFTDADADCLPAVASAGNPTADTNDGNPDVDGDKLADGIEVAVGSSPTVADADADGANDYDELFQYTNPGNADTDGDGSKDKADNGSDETAGVSIQDTVNDDNCPSVSNPDPDGTGFGVQTNSDSGATYHATVNAPVTGDASNPDEDVFGNECDNDADNDGLNDVAEASMVIVPWGGFSGSPTTVCKKAGTAGGVAPSVAMSPLDGDEDRDRYISGIECSQRARPDMADNTVATCGVGDLDGCAQPGAATGGGDADSDGLYLPGAGPSPSSAVETFYRTQSITQTQGTTTGTVLSDMEDCPAGMCTAAAVGPDAKSGNADSDSDGDKLNDGTEVNFYGTSPSSPDSDHDGCSDGREAADVTGDFNVTAGDLGSVASKFGLYRNANGTITTGVNYGKINFDFNKDGNIAAGDLGAVASYFGACPIPKGGLVVTPLFKTAPAN